jgi:hypothetical protein
MSRVVSRRPVPRWHKAFLAITPQIVGHARIAFCYLDTEAKQEAVQEVVCNALKAFVRLVQLGKANLAYPTVLAKYGVAQTRDHRKVGGHLNVHDVSSEYCQRLKGITGERLDKYDCEEECWQEVLVPDQTCTPAELAASRIDFPAWLRTLSRRDRKVAQFLAVGNRSSDAARKFGVCTGRISQIRKELAESWRRFVGDEPATAAA